MLLKISEMLPKESFGILACCSPVPPLVRQCLHEIHYIVKNAREQTFENVSNILALIKINFKFECFCVYLIIFFAGRKVE